MTVINYSNARNNFKSIMDKLNEDQDEIIITSKDNNVVMIPNRLTINLLKLNIFIPELLIPRTEMEKMRNGVG